MKIFVGMSGGVDSSVSAALLHEQGHQVIGVFIKGWYPEDFACTWREDRLDAMRVAAHLGIPFHTLDLSNEYKQHVIDYLIREYQAGRTPNPDTLCNRDIKFGHFFQWAQDNGADAVATGHYAQVRHTPKDAFLLRGKDTAKDQSYFLYTLTQRELPYTLFPIGGYEKSYVRQVAEQKKIPVAKKPDSQGLCFLGKLDMEDFLAAYIPPHPGNILDVHGSVIGKHNGVHLYTLGQRHGVGGGGGSPLPQYVIAKDVKNNTVTLGPRTKLQEQAPKELILRDVSWTVTPPESSDTLSLQYRYHGPIVSIDGVSYHDDTLRLSFNRQLPEQPSPGQAVVLYNGNVCCGGGVVL